MIITVKKICRILHNGNARAAEVSCVIVDVFAPRMMRDAARAFQLKEKRGGSRGAFARITSGDAVFA
jgi:hypothetical protein